MLTRFKQYVKSSRFLRVLLFPPIWLRRKRLTGRVKALMKNYNQVVRGGEMIVSPTNFPGRFKLDATSDLAKRLILDGTFEPELTALLTRFADCGGDAVNIGANVGFYSVFFAQNFPNVRRVLAIEPNPEAYELLQSNIEANGVKDRVEVLQVCIGEVSGQVDLAFVPGRSEYSSIGRIVHTSVSGLVQNHITVDVLPLTEIESGSTLEPGIIFVDTEGAELLVLKGAESIIREYKPLLFFECEDELLKKFDHSSKLLHSYVTALGYEVRNALSPKTGLSHPFTGVAVAVPANRQDWLSALQGKNGSLN